MAHHGATLKAPQDGQTPSTLDSSRSSVSLNPPRLQYLNTPWRCSCPTVSPRGSSAPRLHAVPPSRLGAAWGGGQDGLIAFTPSPASENGHLVTLMRKTDTCKPSRHISSWRRLSPPPPRSLLRRPWHCEQTSVLARGPPRYGPVRAQPSYVNTGRQPQGLTGTDTRLPDLGPLEKLKKLTL